MQIKNAKKIVLKLGSTTVVDGKGIFKKKWVTSLIKDIKKYGKGKNFVIVSSGAIALGQKYLKIKKGKIKLELSNYDKNLIKKKEIIFFNKSDLFEDNEINEKLKEFKKKIKTKYEIISVYSNKDIQKIKKILIKNAN